MISTELGHLADWCLGISAKGRAIDPDMVGYLAKVLLDLSHQAKQLERLPVDDTALVLNDVCND
jgi:hypothetical protein